MFQHARPDQLVKGDAITAGRDEGRARAHRYLEALLLLQAALLELGGRLSQILDAVDMDRAITFQVVRQQDVRWAAGEFDHGHARPHAFDGKTQLPAEHIDEVAHVGGDILAGRVKVVELEKRSQESAKSVDTSTPFRSVCKVEQ